ncbi:hypothetical protein SODALDRAFT_319744 [Sodiomyces alkalinus F11]|uniref:Uncharacterized protein n=1 Tax=Sodiomyces alkalinus (strain CBS 110278 / VKM F-3762 / F11) TaxID=1314773 RepID=A0A3N2Q944_SODAK|nr:hypothetical protein SODALDRAFT_319744 [Sodiomyces alkalinus F11]ROT43246.1 hypothetical protein SODALDRAFT_319744 [Sodiomyces alkalinus F11]
MAVDFGGARSDTETKMELPACSTPTELVSHMVEREDDIVWRRKIHKDFLATSGCPTATNVRVNYLSDLIPPPMRRMRRLPAECRSMQGVEKYDSVGQEWVQIPNDNMKFIAVLPLVAAVLAAPTLQKRVPGEITQVLLCTEPNFGGKCEKVDFTLNYPNACHPIPEPFRNNLGSIRPDRGALCRLTTVSAKDDCDTHGDLFIESPGFADLFSKTDHSGQAIARNAHHIECQQCTNCQG